MTGSIESETSNADRIPLYLNGNNSVSYSTSRHWFYIDNKVEAPLGPTMNHLLLDFLHHPNEVLSQIVLYSSLYPESPFPTTKADLLVVRNLIQPSVSRLRVTLRKLNPELQKAIQTVRGSGYLYVPHLTVA